MPLLLLQKNLVGDNGFGGRSSENLSLGTMREDTFTELSRVMDLLFIEEGRQRSPMVESINRSRVSYSEELLP